MEKPKVFNFAWDLKQWSLGAFISGGTNGVGFMLAIGPFAMSVGTI